ncbi:hypothetical protein J3A83DRAFT_1156766 [Scleroderma citrinum]
MASRHVCTEEYSAAICTFTLGRRISGAKRVVVRLLLRRWLVHYGVIFVWRNICIFIFRGRATALISPHSTHRATVPPRQFHRAQLTALILTTSFAQAQQEEKGVSTIRLLILVVKGMDGLYLDIHGSVLATLPHLFALNTMAPTLRYHILNCLSWHFVAA